MANRPAWIGEIKVALVSCSVAMHPAITRSEKIRFHYLNAATGNRLRQHYVDEVTGEFVPPEDRIRGYETGDGGHAMLTEAELDQIGLPGSRVLEIVRFVPADAVDRLYLDQPFFVLPEDEADVEVFVVLRDAMARAGVAGLGQTMIHRREHPVLLEPRGRGMLATTLHYADDIRSDAPALNPRADRPASSEMVRLASGMVGRLEGDFAPDLFRDRYREALADLIEAKRTGAQWVLPGPTDRGPARLELAEALRRSGRALADGPPGRLAGSRGALRPISTPQPTGKQPAQANASSRHRPRGGS